MSFRLVMRRVLVGGVGCEGGGKVDRSRDRVVDEPRRSIMGLDGEEGVDVGDRDPDIFAVAA